MLEDNFNDLTLNDLIGLDESLKTTLTKVINQQLETNQI